MSLTIQNVLEGFAAALALQPALIGYNVSAVSVNEDKLQPRDVLITEEGWENSNDVADQFQMQRFKMPLYVVVAYSLPNQSALTSFDITQKQVDISLAIQKTVRDTITAESGYGYVNLTMGGTGKRITAAMDLRCTVVILEWEQTV